MRKEIRLVDRSYNCGECGQRVQMEYYTFDGCGQMFSEREDAESSLMEYEAKERAELERLKKKYG